MAGLLGDIYSTIDSTKRKLSDFVQNPVESTRQFIFNQNEDAGKQLGLLDQSFRGANGQLTIGPQTPQAQAAHNQLTDGLLSAMMGATVWHGSPHKFNKFDSSKIGTGEGAQAYGHGLYLAESPDVANWYKSTLSGLDQLTPEGRAARYMDRANGDTQRAMRLAWDDYNASADSPTMMNAAYAAIEKLQSGKTPSPSLYKVDLPDEHIAKMLDWDKPLSQQAPEVQAALQKHGIGGSPAWDEITGVNLINQLGQRLDQSNTSAAASKALQQAGIPGIRYLDGGSRASGAGTSNYVVFPGNEGLLKILERNGQGLPGN